jgi:hypothetical protein
VIDEIATVLSSVFNAQVRQDERGLRTLVCSDGAYFTTRIRVDPVAEVFIATRPLDGFELALRWNGGTSSSEFHHAFAMTTNDDEMSRLWLDDHGRRALLDSATTSTIDEVSFGQAGLAFGDPFFADTTSVRRTWTYEIANDELVVTKGGTEFDPNRIAIAVRTGCALAGRSQRWARQYADLAVRLGVTARTDLEIGGKPIITAVRQGLDVGLHLIRRVADEKTGRLRTLISARRVSQDERTLSIVDEHAVRAAVPPVPKGGRRDFELEGYRLRTSDAATKLDELAKKLVAAARPIAVVADLDSIDVWFDGAPLEHERLDPAFALAAHLAIGSAAQSGPYR